MALGKNYNKNIFGQVVTIPNAYIKINKIEGDKNNLFLFVTMYDQYKTNIVEENVYNFIPNVDNTSSNFIKQGYDYLKTLDKYKDATDLLDEG